MLYKNSQNIILFLKTLFIVKVDYLHTAMVFVLKNLKSFILRKILFELPILHNNAIPVDLQNVFA